MKRSIWSRLPGVFVGIVALCAFQVDAHADAAAQRKAEDIVMEYFTYDCGYTEHPECSDFRAALKSMLKIAGPYSDADLIWGAPTNVAEVGKKYCIGVYEQNKTIEQCFPGGWGGGSS